MTNNFANLSAESPEHNLATIAPEEFYIGSDAPNEHEQMMGVHFLDTQFDVPILIRS